MTPTIDDIARIGARLGADIATAVQGAPSTVRLALTALLAEGHLLLEDVPGVGKTTLARAMAATIDASWSRIQFTPDLMPSDVTGVSVFRQHSASFEFQPGPVFANIVVADELNRASARTQSALLEVMAERNVTVDGVSRPVPRPFCVVATQNPVDLDGTYRLPEAQLDRFLIRTRLGYPDTDAELGILSAASGPDPVARIPARVSAEAMAAMIETVRTSVHVAEPVARYLVALAAATRAHPDVRLGASPRATLALQAAAKAWAALDGRDFVTPDDVRDLAPHVLAHRIVLTPDAELHGRRNDGVIAAVLSDVPAPATAAAGAAAAARGN